MNRNYLTIGIILVALTIGIFASLQKTVGQSDEPNAEAAREVSLVAINQEFVRGTEIRQFVQITSSANSYFYLIDFSPDGKATLLAPSRLTPQNQLTGNETITWPESFTDSPFVVPEALGDHSLRVYVTPTPINLFAPPSTSPSEFTLLGEGNETMSIEDEIEQLIASHGIGINSWATDTDIITVGQPNILGSGGDDETIDLRVFVKDDTGANISEIFRPMVFISGNQQGQIDPISIPEFNPNGTEVRNVRRDNSEVRLRAEALRHESLPNNPCLLQIEGTSITDTLSPCELSGDDLEIAGTLLITLTLNRDIDILADFALQPIDPGLGQMVKFDGSRSRANTSIVQYSWNFGDGTTESSNSPVMFHQYSAIDEYQTQLSIETSTGESAMSAQKSVVVGSGTPSCQDSDSPTLGLCPDVTTGDFFIGLDPVNNIASVSGTSGSAKFLYTITPELLEQSDVHLPEGPAIAELKYVLVKLPQDIEAISQISIRYLSSNDQTIKTESIRDNLFLNTPNLEAPPVGVENSKKVELNVPPATAKIVYQITTSIIFNDSNEEIELAFRDFRFDSSACDSILVLDQAIYDLGDRVIFTFCNLSDRVVTLRNLAPWEITDLDGNPVFNPISGSQVIELDPESHLVFEWNQRDNQGLQVPEGNYRLVFDGGELLQNEATIIVRDL